MAAELKVVRIPSVIRLRPSALKKLRAVEAKQSPEARRIERRVEAAFLGLPLDAGEAELIEAVL